MRQIGKVRDSARLIVASLLTLGSALAIGLSSLGAASANSGMAGGSSGGAAVNGSSSCSVELLAPKNRAFTVTGNMATTQLRINGPGSCRQTVSLSSWNAPIGVVGFRPFANQQFFMGETIPNLRPGEHTLSIQVNKQCSFQIDALLGSRQKTAAGNANFGSNLLGYTQVNAGVCQAPRPAPKPTPQSQPQPAPAPTPAPTQTTANVCSGNVSNTTSAPAAQGGNCSTNTTIVQSQTQTPSAPPSQGQDQSQSQQASTSTSGGMGAADTSAAQSQTLAVPATTEDTTSAAPAPAMSETAPATTSSAPTSLVNTGPATIGGLVGLFTGVTLLGTLAYDRLLRRKLRA